MIQQTMEMHDSGMDILATSLRHTTLDLQGFGLLELSLESQRALSWLTQQEMPIIPNVAMNFSITRPELQYH